MVMKELPSWVVYMVYPEVTMRNMCIFSVVIMMVI